MSAETSELLTIQDFVRWGTSRFRATGLHFGHGTDNAIDEAAWLIAHALHLPQPLPERFADCSLTASEREAVLALLERRVAERRPAAYLTGSVWFAGVELVVDERVMVPRSPMAELIEDGFAPWLDPDRLHRILDLCAGSGCIGLATALHLPEAIVDLVDLSSEALAVAELNRQRLRAIDDSLASRVRMVVSDLFSALNERAYDLILSNPPYVGREELEHLPPEYHHEPRQALLAGDDGLDLVLHILHEAPDRLSRQGSLLMEVGHSAPALEACCPQVPFTWLEFRHGGDGVFLLSREQLLEHRAAFKRPSPIAD